jgi:hypothetical protein
MVSKVETVRYELTTSRRSYGFKTVRLFTFRGSSLSVLMSTRRMTKAKVNRPRQNGRKRQGPARRSVATGPMGRLIPHPPPINGYEVKHSRTLRFTTNAAVSQQITFQNLLDTILFVTGTTTAIDLFNVVRVRRVKIWAMPVIGQSTSVTIIFDGAAIGFVGDREVHEDASMGVEPAYLSVSPSKQSLASKFQASGSQNAFFIEGPANSIIDVDLDFKADTQGAQVASQNVPVGVNTAIAYRGLDGLAVATSKFIVPTSLNTV